MRRGLVFQQYKQAEEAFERVIQLDEDCEDAKQELETVKIQQLVEMGFVEDQAFAAIQQYGSVQVWAFAMHLACKCFSVCLALHSALTLRNFAFLCTIYLCVFAT
jgi:hypothetical protein